MSAVARIPGISVFLPSHNEEGNVDRVVRSWLAECPRVVKGYGDTHIRGRKSFDVLMNALPKLTQANDAAQFLKKLRDAALADDTGEKLVQALQGLPA